MSSRTVTVTWHEKGQERQHRSYVILTEGYSTEADVPTILALRHLKGEADRVIVDRIVDRPTS